MDTNDELFLKLKDLISSQFELEPEKVTPEATFRGDLGADSLDTYELLYALESEIGVKIPEYVVNNFVKVEDVYNYLKSQGK